MGLAIMGSLCSEALVGRTVVSQISSFPNPWTCKYITLYGKRDLADMIILRILIWGDYPGLFR